MRIVFLRITDITTSKWGYVSPRIGNWKNIGLGLRVVKVTGAESPNLP